MAGKYDNLYDDLLEIGPVQITRKPEDSLDRLYDDLLPDEGDPIPSGPHAFQRGMLEAAKNVPASAANLAGDVLGAITSPLETLAAGGELAKGLGNKLGRKAAEFVQGQEMEPMPERPEVAADVVGEAIMDRYGSPQAVASTLINDPVGAAFDVGGVGGAAIRPLRSMEPMTAAGRGTQSGAKGLARHEYGKVAGLPKSMLKEDYQKLVDRGLDEKVILSKKGMKKLDGIYGDLANDMNELISRANDLPGKRIKTGELNKYLDDLMKSLEGTDGGQANIAKVKQMKNNLYREFGVNDPRTGKRYLKQNLTIDDLQKYKTNIYEQVYDLKSDVARRGDIATKVKSERGRAAKEAIENAVPEIKDLNVRWGELKELHPYLEKAMNRANDIEPGMGKLINQTMQNPKARSGIAVALNRLAEGDMGWLEKNLNTNQIRVALALAGRNQQTLEEETEYQ
jgi:hypothetical protein